MEINVSIQYNGGLLPDIILSTRCSYIGEPFMVLSLQPMFLPKPLDTLPLEMDGLDAFRFLKKNQTTPRPSEHPPVMGGKMSKRLGGIKRLQIQNHFMAFKQVPRCR